MPYTATCDWSACTKSGKWTVLNMGVRGIDFDAISTIFSIRFVNYFESLVFFFTFYYQNIFVEKKRKQVAQNMLINLLTLFVTSLMLWPAINSASFNLAWCCPLRTLVHPVTFGVCIPTFNWACVSHVHLIYCLSVRPKTPH